MSSFLEYIYSQCDRVLICDTEYKPDITNTTAKDTLCYVYKDIKTGEVFRYWEYKNQRYGQQHFDLENTLIVCHYALAEVGSFICDLMPRPKNIWDTWVEAKTLYNGARSEFSMLAVASEYNIPNLMTEDEKEIERKLILDQEEYTVEEQKRILNYCEKDVHTTGEIFINQVKDFEKKFKLKTIEDYQIRFNQICMRGAAMSDFAKINVAGIPVNLKRLNHFKKHWPAAREYLINKYNDELKVYDENKVFNQNAFAELLKRIDENIYLKWPRTFTNKLSLTEKTFEKFNHIPEIAKVLEVRKLMTSTTLGGYCISGNGRSVTNLRPFATSSGRCAPGGATFPFNASAWIRNFITPPTGSYLCYIDYSSQEPAIQGYLSGDENLIAAYKSGDIYIHTAKLAKAVPEHATKQSHPEERSIWKVLFLATSYGMGKERVAAKLKIKRDEAAALLVKFKKIYRKYYNYIEGLMHNLGRDLWIETCFGFSRHLSKYKRTTDNSWRNFPIQSHGAEILRVAINKLHDNHIKIVATVHDALLIEIPIAEHKQQIDLARKLMTEAAIDVVGGRIETDFKIIDHRGFIQDEGPQKMYEEIMSVVEKVSLGESEVRAPVQYI